MSRRVALLLTQCKNCNIFLGDSFGAFLNVANVHFQGLADVLSESHDNDGHLGWSQHGNVHPGAQEARQGAPKLMQATKRLLQVDILSP